MPATESTKSSHAETIADACHKFQFTRNPRLRALINFYPLLLLFVFALDLILFGKIAEASWTQPVRYSSYTALVVAALFYYRLTRLAPHTFQIIWERGSIRASESDYVAYLHDSEKTLNDPRGRWLSFAAGALGLIILFAIPDLPENSAAAAVRLFFLRAPFVFLSWLLIGAVVWRLFTLGRIIDQLAQRFSLNVQRGFPDQCGGLAPLGELSASNATILLAPGLYVVGGFLFFGADPKTVLFLILGVIFEVIALVAVFVLPLTEVHNEMLRQRERYYQEMATLARRIDDNARELIEPSQLPDPSEIQKRLQILQALRQFYQEHHDFPTWPFEFRRLAFALSAPQALSLLTGVGLQRFIPSWVLDLMKLFGK